MNNFAVIENDQIVNIITCEALVIAQALLPNFVVKEESEFTGKAIIGGKVVNEKFVAPKPYNSWILNEASLEWESPIPYPTDGVSYVWNDSDLIWELFVPLDFEA
jgi:hypothetical protein